MPTRSRYKYIDDTGQVWALAAVDYLAEVGNLEKIPNPSWRPFPPLRRDYEPRHIKLVATKNRPGLQKYRTEIVVNDNDFTKFLNKIFFVDGHEMRCISFVGERHIAY